MNEAEILRFFTVLNVCAYLELYVHAHTWGMREHGGAVARTMANRASRRACDHVTGASRDALTHKIKLCILKFRLFKYHTGDGCVIVTRREANDDDGDAEDDDVRRSTIGEFNRRDNDVTGSRMMDRKMKKKKRIADKQKRCDERDNEMYRCTYVYVYMHTGHTGRVNEMEKVAAERVQISGNEIGEFRDTVCFARGRRERVTRAERKRKRE